MDEAIRNFAPRSFAAAAAAMCALNTTQRLPQIKAPTLIIGTPDDPGAPREVTEMMARMIPNATLSWLEPARHLSSLEHPNRFNELVRAFCIVEACLTEAEARAQGIDPKTSVLSLGNVPRALAARDTRGLIKLVADSATKKLVGAHILAPEGADSIQTAAIAIKQGMAYTDLGEMIFPYLTTVEGLKLAAQTFDMDVSMLSCCAG